MLFAEERVGVRTADRKYVLWENGKEEAYDLGADPHLTRDHVEHPVNANEHRFECRWAA